MLGSRDVARHSFQRCFKLCEEISEEIGDYVAPDFIHELEPRKISEWPRPIAADVYERMARFSCRIDRAGASGFQPHRQQGQALRYLA
jgi:hypothetical protein